MNLAEQVESTEANLMFKLTELPEPLPLVPGSEPPSSVLARLRRDER